MTASQKPSPIILGCMQLGGTWDDAQLSKESIENTLECVRVSRQNGITMFDHADIYCLGKSEEAFGHVWSELGVSRDSVVLQTKCGIRRADEPDPGSPHRFDFSYEHITTSVRKSLERLRTEYVDILLLHRPDPLMDPEQVALAFTDLRNEGLVWQFGVSNFTAAQIELLQSFLPEPIVANQVEFNLLHADLIDDGVTFNNADQRRSYRSDGTLEFCQLKDIEVQAYSPLARGQLTPVADNAGEQMKRAAEAVANAADAKGVTPEAILASWIIRHPANIRPVIGTTKPHRIIDIAAAAKVELSREEWYRLWLAARPSDIP